MRFAQGSSTALGLMLGLALAVPASTQAARAGPHGSRGYSSNRLQAAVMAMATAIRGTGMLRARPHYWLWPRPLRPPLRLRLPRPYYGVLLRLRPVLLLRPLRLCSAGPRTTPGPTTADAWGSPWEAALRPLPGLLTPSARLLAPPAGSRCAVVPELVPHGDALPLGDAHHDAPPLAVLAPVRRDVADAVLGP